jgi:cyclopropane-fatty-acyl-phospholipid synthase
MSKSRTLIESLLSHAGITLNGNQPWDIQVHDDRLYRRVLAQGSLGLGESYMDGWWDVDELDEFFCRVLRSELDSRVEVTPKSLWMYVQASILNMQSRVRSRKVARQHYDLGNDFYISFLDPYNQYTSGYFRDTDDLNEAQEQKLDLICRKLQLSADDRVLDIGCGWGGFAKYAASHYGCHVTGITISEEQLKYARAYCGGLPVTIQKRDYRDLNKTYDKILICGMIEHVGYKNYRRIMKVVHENLAEQGLFLLHTIGGNTSARFSEPWMNKYIFPNSMLPSARQLSAASEGLFVMEDWHNFGTHYVKTLKAWFDNFQANWDSFRTRYGERFYRMWKYYLLSCAGGFRARKMQLWQIVFSKQGDPEGYCSIR